MPGWSPLVSGWDPAVGLPTSPTPLAAGPAGWWRHGPSTPFVLSEVRGNDVVYFQDFPIAQGDHRDGHGARWEHDPAGFHRHAHVRQHRAACRGRGGSRRGPLEDRRVCSRHPTVTASCAPCVSRSRRATSRVATARSRRSSSATIRRTGTDSTTSAGRCGSSRSTTGARSGSRWSARSPATRSGRRSTSRRRSRTRSGRSSHDCPAAPNPARRSASTASVDTRGRRPRPVHRRSRASRRGRRRSGSPRPTYRATPRSASSRSSVASTTGSSRGRSSQR